MKDPISWAAAPVLSAQLGKGDKFINLAAAACRLMLVLLCVDVLTAGQRCFYGMVMELETFPSMVINHLVVWFSLLFFHGLLGRIFYFRENQT